MPGPWDRYKTIDKQPEGARPWEKYSDSPAAPVEKDNSEAAQTALESYGNAMTLGYLPHIQAGVGSMMGLGDYIELRDDNIKRQARLSEENPKSSMAGSGVGLVASGLLPVGAAAKSAGFLAKAGAAAKTGAAMGLVANPGDIEGELSPLQLEGRTKNAAIGAVTGAGIQGAASGIGKIAEKVAPKLKDLAESKAFKALGPNNKARELANAKGEDKIIGRALLDQEAIPVLGTPRRIAKRVEDLKEKAGMEIGGLIDKAESLKVPYTPIKISNPKRPVMVQDEVSMTPIRFDENPAKRSMPWLSSKDAPPKIVRGNEQLIQRKLFEKPKPSIKAGEVKMTPVAGMQTDAKEITDGIIRSKEMKSLEDQFGSGPAKAALTEYLDNIGSNGQVGLKRLQELRQAVDRGINFSKRSDQLTPAQEILYSVRTKLRDKMNDIANKMPGVDKDALIKANRKYSGLESASDILEKKIAADGSNRSIGLTDTIMMAGGVAGGGTPGTKAGLALALGGANKFARTFGDSIAARGYDSASKVAAKGGGLLNSANTSPAIKGLINKASQGDFIENEDLSPEYLQILSENPELIERIEDEKTRASVLRKMGRSPSSKKK